MESAALMDSNDSQSMAVSIGEIKTAVNYIKESTERRLTNTESFQMSVQKEVARIDTEVNTLKTTMKNNFIWIGSILSSVALVAPFLVRLVFG